MVLGTMLAVPGLFLIDRTAVAEKSPPKLSESDPSAQALAYHNDADSIDASENLDRGSSEYCHNCTFIQGEDGDQWRPCQIFPNNLVNADGWCKTWTKPAA